MDGLFDVLPDMGYPRIVSSNNVSLLRSNVVVMYQRLTVFVYVLPIPAFTADLNWRINLECLLPIRKQNELMDVPVT